MPGDGDTAIRNQRDGGLDRVDHLFSTAGAVSRVCAVPCSTGVAGGPVRKSQSIDSRAAATAFFHRDKTPTQAPSQSAPSQSLWCSTQNSAGGDRIGGGGRQQEQEQAGGAAGESQDLLAGSPEAAPAAAAAVPADWCECSTHTHTHTHMLALITAHSLNTSGDCNTCGRRRRAINRRLGAESQMTQDLDARLLKLAERSRRPAVPAPALSASSPSASLSSSPSSSPSSPSLATAATKAEEEAAEEVAMEAAMEAAAAAASQGVAVAAMAVAGTTDEEAPAPVPWDLPTGFTNGHGAPFAKVKRRLQVHPTPSHPSHLSPPCVYIDSISLISISLISIYTFFVMRKNA